MQHKQQLLQAQWHYILSQPVDRSLKNICTPLRRRCSLWLDDADGDEPGSFDEEGVFGGFSFWHSKVSFDSCASALGLRGKGELGRRLS
jgi:hypothetical protein